MKIYLDLQKQVITKTTDENIYQGDIYSNAFEILFYNYTDSNWFPTMSQLAPNGRKAGEFTADALDVGESLEYTEDGVTYLKFTFTMGTSWVLMKGRSEFYIWFNRLGGAIVQKKCVGVVNIMIDHSTEDYFIADPTFNPNVKAYIDACIAELGDGSPKYFDTASNIANCTEDKGLAVATDTGHLYYWDETKNSTTKYTDSGLVYNDLSAYYTKTEVNSALSLKADKTTTYTKTEADNTFAPKSNAIKHDGNHLKDYSGNNIYPITLNDTIIDNLKKSFIDGTNLFDNSNIESLVYNESTNVYENNQYWKTGDYIDVSKYNGYYLYTNLPANYYKVVVYRPNGNLYGVFKTMDYTNPFILNDARVKIRICVANAYVESAIFTLSQVTPTQAPTDVLSGYHLKNSKLSNDFKETFIKPLVSNRYKEILEGGNCVTPTRNLCAIVGGVVELRGKVFVTLEANNTTPFESKNTAFSELVVFDIIHPEDYEVYTIIQAGDRVEGVAVDIVCAWDTCCIKLNNTTIRCISKIFYDGTLNPSTSWFVYRDFDITTKTFGNIYNCYVTNTSNVAVKMSYDRCVQLATDFGVETFPDTYSNKGMLLNTNIINTGTYFYAVFSFENGSHLLMRSSDGATWNFLSDVPLGIPSEEVQLAYDTNYNTDILFAVNRSPYPTNPTVYIKKYRISTNTWIGSKQLSIETYGGCERPAFEIKDNRGYVVIWGEGANPIMEGKTLTRTNKKIFKIILDNLETEASVTTLPEHQVIYPMLKRIGTEIYIFCNTDKRGYIFDNSDGRQEIYVNRFDTQIIGMLDNPFSVLKS